VNRVAALNAWSRLESELPVIDTAPGTGKIFTKEKFLPCGETAMPPKRKILQGLQPAKVGTARACV
jgi:hypothetical protein